MKIVFWISAITMLIAEFFLLMGFVNVYLKNYNGGPQSSSGTIIYQAVFGLIILVTGFYCYFTGRIKIALAIMALPILLVLLYLIVVVILPYISGERMN
ncbi:MAG: hypothetical protein QM802_22235 [Agriterribacter sp.]